MLELKLRPLTASQIEFLRRWDAEDDDELWRTLDDVSISPIYARKFACLRCGGKASEYIFEVSALRLWEWDCFCEDCIAPRIEDALFPAWTGWKINRRGFVPLMRRKTCGDMTRLNIVVPDIMDDEIVWRRGITVFKTITQATVASPRDVRRLGPLQILRGIA